MRLNVEYAAQIKRTAGMGSEQYDVDAPCALRGLVDQIVARHGDDLRNLLLDDHGHLQRSLLIFVGDDQARADENTSLQDGCVVSFLTPISGG